MFLCSSYFIYVNNFTIDALLCLFVCLFETFVAVQLKYKTKFMVISGADPTKAIQKRRAGSIG